MASRGSVKRAAWFELGAKANGWLYPGAPPHYVCPLCGIAFPRSALDRKLLTLEHAPPEGLKLGGGEICLTCKRCNDKFGAELDCHMIDCQELADLWNGRTSESQRARF